ncbi:MAG: GNAT family N-acetyltransferase [Micromonosporaceae bacterium]
MTTLPGVLRAAETGTFPSADGGLTIVPPTSPRESAVLAFTAHNVVVTATDPGWVRGQLPDGDLSAPLNPPFLAALSHRLGRRVNNIDMVTLASPLPGPPPAPLAEIEDRDHPRVARALWYRDDVRVWVTDGGVVLLGRGLGGRWETAVEVAAEHRGRGLGRTLATAARHLVPDGRPIWAQIAPGNAASVRVFLASGYLPVGAEALLVPGGTPRSGEKGAAEP